MSRISSLHLHTRRVNGHLDADGRLYVDGQTYQVMSHDYELAVDFSNAMWLDWTTSVKSALTCHPSTLRVHYATAVRRTAGELGLRVFTQTELFSSSCPYAYDHKQGRFLVLLVGTNRSFLIPTLAEWIAIESLTGDTEKVFAKAKESRWSRRHSIGKLHR